MKNKLVIKTGSKIVYVRRIKEIIMLESKHLPEIFHKEELNDCLVEDLAQIFALKEAILKAFEIKTERWLEIKVNIKGDRPKVDFDKKLSKEIKKDKIESCDFCVSCDHEYAIATAVFLIRKSALS